MMNEKHGWTFTCEAYTDIIEPVYCEVNESKAAFVEFCAVKDLNGLQVLKAYLPQVSAYAGVAGMDIWQIYAVCLNLREKDDENARLRKLLENERAAKDAALNRIAAIRGLLEP